ncbi:MAG TPA: hypothetical protein VL358_14660 [Caulobacteraceae bacterium]|jgi:hypothetical protein|nr:hypothetical protein [Caulobacteraceae bacterium]
MSTILFSSVIALGAVGAVLAQDAGAQPQRPGARPGGPGAAGGPIANGGPRAPPAEGGAVGVVDSVSPSSFVITTSAGRKVTIETTPATTYQNGTNAASASAVKKGERVLVLGLVKFDMGARAPGGPGAARGPGAAGAPAGAARAAGENDQANTTIAASRVSLQPANAGAKAEIGMLAAPGTPPVVKQVGQAPANYTQGEGTLVSGPEAAKATEAALGAWTGGVINRVVKLTDGGYEVHNISVSWPHHIFVDKNFKYTGAW